MSQPAIFHSKCTTCEGKPFKYTFRETLNGKQHGFSSNMQHECFYLSKNIFCGARVFSKHVFAM